MVWVLVRVAVLIGSLSVLKQPEDVAIEYPADWKRHGRRAGYVRNEQMLAAGPDLVVAFHRDSSRGTAHTISLARRAGIEVIMYEPPSVAR